MLDALLAEMLRGFRKPKVSPAARRNGYPARQLSARPLTLSEDTRIRGGKKSRRRVARVWR